MNNLGRILILAGIILILAGVTLNLLVRLKIPFPGRLPGDIFIRRENFSFYFPLTTSLLVSVILSLVLYLFWRK